LPQLESRITAMAFQPKTNKLAVICCNHQVLHLSYKRVGRYQWMPIKLSSIDFRSFHRYSFKAIVYWFPIFPQIFLFKPSSGKLTDWSKQALEHGLPKQWIGHHYKVINVQFDPSNHGLMLLQDDQMFTLLDLTEVTYHVLAGITVTWRLSCTLLELKIPAISNVQKEPSCF